MNQLTDAQFNELIDSIARPCFNYMLKRVKKQILDNKEFKNLDANQFYNILVACMSSIDTNMLQWIKAFHKIKTNEEINFVALKAAFHTSLEKQSKMFA